MKITLHKHLGSSDKGLSSYIQIIDLSEQMYHDINQNGRTLCT